MEMKEITDNITINKEVKYFTKAENLFFEAGVNSDLKKEKESN
jgi:hypothetical protein